MPAADHWEPTTMGHYTLGLTVDPPQRGKINLTLPRRKTPYGAGILVWGPLATLVLVALILVLRYGWKMLTSF